MRSVHLIAVILLSTSCGLQQGNFNKQKFTRLKSLNSESAHYLEKDVKESLPLKEVLQLTSSSLCKVDDNAQLNLDLVSSEIEAQDQNNSVVEPVSETDTIHKKIEKAIANDNPIILELNGRKIWLEKPEFHDGDCLTGNLRANKDFDRDQLILHIEKYDSISGVQIHINCEEIISAEWAGNETMNDKDSFEQHESNKKAKGGYKMTEKNLYTFMMVFYILGAVGSVIVIPGIALFLVSFVASLFLRKRLRSKSRNRESPVDRKRRIWTEIVFVHGMILLIGGAFAGLVGLLANLLF